MEEFEVKGPEEHAVDKHVEHEAESGAMGFASKVALLTAILSTVGALFSYNGGKSESDTLMHKNEEVLHTAKASDIWAYYQAKSTKQAVMEGALINASTDEAKDELKKKIAKYEDEKAEIQKQAKEEGEKAKEEREHSEADELKHQKWASAMTSIQIAISLAAITILTRNRWLFWGALSISVIGLILGANAFL